MERIVHKTRDFKKATEWDVMQQLQMTIEERQEAAKVLQKRVYGENAPDVREVYKNGTIIKQYIKR
jgi:hypothetical protein